MQDDHCQIVRDEFKVLDRHNPEQLRNFFIRYKFLSTCDLSQVLSMSSRHIRRLKSRAKVTYGRKTSPPPNVKTPPDIKLEPGWDCKEWWGKHYPRYGTTVLSKITGLSVRAVLRHLRKYGVRVRKKGESYSGHPCCTYEWLHHHYEEKRWGLVRCGSIAGVSPDTIAGWLNKHKIIVRSKYDPFVGKAARLAAGATRDYKVREHQMYLIRSHIQDGDS